MNDPSFHADDGQGLGLAELIAAVIARRWLLVGVVVIFTAAFTAAAFIITPTYEAAVVLIPANTERTSQGLMDAAGQLGGIASLVGLSLGSRGGGTDEALAVLRSRQFTEAFIKSRDLMPELYPKKWDAQRKQWNVPAESQPTLARAYKYFDKKIRIVTQDKKTTLVTLKIIWRDREEAADWANDLAARLNQEIRTRAMQKADLAVGFLDHELQATTTVVTRDAIGRLMEGEVKQRMLANVTQEYAFRVVDRAMPADRDDPVWPHKFQLIAGGAVVGLALGIFWIFLSGSLRPRLSVLRRE
jgi:uncharacterized protein involved in exopolysaccharide biosynthesis